MLTLTHAFTTTPACTFTLTFTPAFTSTHTYTHIYPMPCKIQPIRGQDYRCVFCGMQRVICNGLYSTLLYRHSLRAKVCWCLFEDFPKASSETFQLLRAITNISDHIRKSFPKISKDFPKILKSHKNI